MDKIKKAGCQVAPTFDSIGNHVDSNYKAFSVCMDATSLAVVDPNTVSNCVTMANSFTLSPNPTTWTLSNLTGFSDTTTATVYLFSGSILVDAIFQLRWESQKPDPNSRKGLSFRESISRRPIGSAGRRSKVLGRD